MCLNRAIKVAMRKSIYWNKNRNSWQKLHCQSKSGWKCYICANIECCSFWGPKDQLSQTSSHFGPHTCVSEMEKAPNYFQQNKDKVVPRGEFRENIPGIVQIATHFISIFAPASEKLEVRPGVWPSNQIKESLWVIWLYFKESIINNKNMAVVYFSIPTKLVENQNNSSS